MNFTIKNLPPEVHARLQEAAKRSGRSLNKQIVTTLERAVSPVAVDRSTLLKRVRLRREGMETWLEDANLDQLKRGGRM
ncbi:plasmid stability protein [Puniceicoccales bacterium CK1056]|uniref:Plasmid stability protein n=2 Tax=Oceanipulchritudo coccoides TaxID=2706888 RepID=A0A6B2M130_9BACT|nr:plasmid stability protein [Oceanipulchritudo coccoides]NDV62618.1 plasmid stability protein [Oceanipulchritudo coccoides]